MDLATIIGIILGFGLIIGSIFLGGSLLLFIDIPSVMIVVGGTIAATLIKSPIGEILGVFSVVRNAFQTHENETEALIQKVSALAVKARKDGVLGLAKEPIDFPFLQRGIQLVADGVTADMVRTILKTEINFLSNRHRRGKRIFAGMGESAPAMGMIGTLIGLVAM